MTFTDYPKAATEAASYTAFNIMKKQMDSQLLFLYQRYYFNKDMGDVQRANYWLGRIKEYELENKL